MKKVFLFATILTVLIHTFGFCFADSNSRKGDPIQIIPPEGWPQGESVAALNDSADVPGDVRSYFPFLLNMGMHYDLLEPTATGNKRWSYVVCADKFYKDGELCGIIKKIIFIGTIKVEQLALYAIGDNQVFLEMQKGVFGTQEYYERQVVLKVPSKKNQKLKWTYHHVRDTSEVYKYSSEYIPSLLTKLGKLKDIIVVTKETYLKGKLFALIEKHYYAKGYGLVRYEAIDESGKVLGIPSREVVKRGNYGS